ncbi:unnamed protein product [Plutella xylostella]|uniref:(diamondback moth) hypothetical protein n=1 Tax=Plutella xylostella TaxID=51655 RepID=A0A8S4DQI0_PLUXY|nr:unnamed protein product [Plutella xylostella]
MAKEESLRRQEAELRLHHAWRLQQPELRAAQTYIANGKLKSAWTQQIVEKELQKKKEEEDTLKILKERDEALRRQIQVEEERLKEKELQMKDLRNSLEGQIAEMSEKETVVNQLRKLEEKEQMKLEQLKYLASKREKQHAKLKGERDATIVNMGLHKYKLKQKVLAVMKEIELDLDVMHQIQKAFLKDYESEVSKCSSYKRVLDDALSTLEQCKERERARQSNIEAMYDGEARQINEKQDRCGTRVDDALSTLEQCRERERARQSNIDAMYDGEARQINEKQDRMWVQEREARACLMADVVATLARQVQERLEANRARQRENVLEREKILDDMERFHSEVKSKERETQLQNSKYSSINTLQSQLNGLQLKREQLQAAVSHEADMKAAAEHERTLRHEIARAHREGSAGLPIGRRQAWA